VALSARDAARLRCADDGSDVYTAWTGTVYSFVPGERQRLLFRVTGMNVARCLRRDDGSWHLTSRELMYYLDPTTGEVLHRWHNPWTEETVPVVHVANSPVQLPLRYARLGIANGIATLSVDVPLFHANTLARDPELAAHAAQPMYQAGEFFDFMAPAAALRDSSSASWPMTLVWSRIGPWLPWMAMAERPGFLLYRASGQKLAGFHELPGLLRQEIATRLPLYRSAPSCLLSQPNQSSWSYFSQHLTAYRRGEQFPVPEPVRDEPCAGG
jgi:hypothetical protein